MQLESSPSLSRSGAAGPGQVLRLFLGSAAAYMAAALLLGVALVVRDALVATPVAWAARWLHVHLALAMGITQAIIGATQFFAAAFLAVMPPSRSLIRAEWALANAGALLMLGGGLANRLAVVAAGGLLLLAAMALLLWSLVAMACRSLHGLDLNLLFYLTAVGFVLIGMTLGILMALGRTGPFYRPDVRLAHMHLNLLGFVTLTIVGTMHTFFPTLVNRPLHSWKLAAWTYGLLTAGALLMSAGFLVGWVPAIAAGGVGEVGGSCTFAYNLWRTRRAAAGPIPLAARHLYASVWFLLATNLVGTELVGRSASPAALAAATHLAEVGFMAQVLVGALLHLVPVAVGVYGRGGRERLQAVMARGGTAQLWLLNAGCAGWAAAAALAGLFPAGEAALRLAGTAAAVLMSLGLLLGMGKAVRCLAAARAA